jgi:hypothetical protein
VRVRSKGGAVSYYERRLPRKDFNEPWEFTPKEEEEAREVGWESAEVRQVWVQGRDDYVESHEDMHRRGREAFFKDL